jgi:hypothetical protein
MTSITIHCDIQILRPWLAWATDAEALLAQFNRPLGPFLAENNGPLAPEADKDCYL